MPVAPMHRPFCQALVDCIALVNLRIIRYVDLIQELAF